MRERALDEREHRRGLVLGLTMAEALLLLVFLLLLVLTALLTRRERTIEALSSGKAKAETELEKTQSELRPILDQLRGGQILDKDQLNDLAARLTMATETERQLRDATQELSRLQTELSSAEGEAKRLAEETGRFLDLSKAAQRIDPDAPPAATLQKGIQVIEAIGPDINTSELKATLAEVSRMRDQLSAEAKRYGSLEQQYDRVRRERENLMRNGAGTTYPSCWTTTDGRNEFIFDVVVTDKGLVVRDNAPPHRKEDNAYTLIDKFDKGVEIQAARFQSATSRLFKWAQTQECRFFVNLRDGTGPGSKQAYQRHRRIVEGHFYIRHLWN